MAEVIPLKSFENYKWKEEVIDKVKTALNYFPELSNETIYLGLLHHEDRAEARVNVTNRIILFNRYKKPDYMTVFHELGHILVDVLANRGEDVPKTSEEFCSILATSRMPPELIDGDIPYIGGYRVPKEDVPKLCKKALEYRRKKRNYIEYCKKLLMGEIRCLERFNNGKVMKEIQNGIEKLNK